MHHRIAIAGWSFPGGAEHAIASWGYLRRLLAELSGPTLFRGVGEAIGFSPTIETLGFVDRASHILLHWAGERVTFAPSTAATAVADLGPRTGVRVAAELPAFLARHPALRFVARTDALRFREPRAGTLFRPRTDRECFT
jgi:hypothetical protein